jgi:hypothetical protein
VKAPTANDRANRAAMACWTQIVFKRATSKDLAPVILRELSEAAEQHAAELGRLAELCLALEVERDGLRARVKELEGRNP